MNIVLNIDDERRAFEEWFEADAMPLESDWFERDNDGDYKLGPVDDSWRGWLARAQTRPDQ